MPEFHQRVAVLQEMGYVDADHTVQLKVRDSWPLQLLVFSRNLHLLGSPGPRGSCRSCGRWIGKQRLKGSGRKACGGAG